jgi:hypothetical protein
MRLHVVDEYPSVLARTRGGDRVVADGSGWDGALILVPLGSPEFVEQTELGRVEVRGEGVGGNIGRLRHLLAVLGSEVLPDPFVGGTRTREGRPAAAGDLEVHVRSGGVEDEKDVPVAIVDPIP